MTRKRNWSLRLRLSLFFAALLFAAWAAAAVLSWLESMKSIDTFFDTQQMLFAKRLASAHYKSGAIHLPDTDDMLAVAGRGDEGEQEDDALAFAVFSPDGKLLLSDGDDGRDFVFNPKANGFVNTRADGDLWRIVWLTSLDRNVVVAVGQELEYRDDLALEMIMGQMLPWLILLPVLLIGLVWMLSRELSPLRSVASSLTRRDPDDTSAIEISVQPEIRPLLQALNSLFARMGAMLSRERSFIANAAHELRTPLAGLSIQAQVAQSARQPETRAHALSQLRKGIDRTSRLVDQLLLLFKLESLHEARAREKDPQNAWQTHLKWTSLLESSLDEVREQLEAKNINLQVHNQCPDAGISGQPELLGVMLRNIVSNATKYTPESGTIDVTLAARSLTIKNTCQDIPPADAARLGERFFRPPGQTQAGSGLGLSIAKRIAQLHNTQISISTTGHFLVTLRW